MVGDKMKYFDNLSLIQEEDIFYKKPEVTTKASEKDILANALGATLYMPAIRGDIADMILNRKYPELGSVVICLEDAIGDDAVALAEENALQQIKMIYSETARRRDISLDELPFIFIRVRTREQMTYLADQLGEQMAVLTGFVFPKFSISNGEDYLETLKNISETYHLHLYGMPILETLDIIDLQTRYSVLQTLRELFLHYQDQILNIRIGATDLCGLYGIRRNNQTTIYDIAILNHFISDIVNYFSRYFTISGPVWEYFENSARVLKPELRKTPFLQGYGEKGLEIRSQLLNEYVDGLIKETLLDKANGITGKTVIHPSHLKIVQSLYVVSYEEYLDAMSIVANSGTLGVVKSDYANKMNEIKPHLKWAEKIMIMSKIYGVYHENHSYIDLLTKQYQTIHHG